MFFYRQRAAEPNKEHGILMGIYDGSGAIALFILGAVLFWYKFSDYWFTI